MAQTEQLIDVDYQWWVDEAIEDLKTNIFACTAGLGSGKTHGAVQWHYDRTALNEGCPFSAYMMPIYELIHNTAIPTFQKVLNDIGMAENYDYTIVKSPFPKLKYSHTKQEVHFLSGNRPDKIKSVEYSHGAADEPGITQKAALTRFRERIRDQRAKARQIMLHGTPEGLNHFSEEFDSDKIPGWDTSKDRDHLLIRQIPETKSEVQYRRFRLTTYDNAKYLPDDYISNLFDAHRENTPYILSYVYGIFVPLVTGNCYKNYSPRLHDMHNIDASPYIPIDLTWDFNANPLAWISIQKRAYEEFDTRVFRYNAVEESNLGAGTLDEACVEFAAKHPVAQFADTPITLYGDSSGHAGSHKTSDTDYQAIKKLLKELGYTKITIRAARSNPLETVSVNAVNDLFLKDMLRICDRCTETKRSLAATSWQENIRKIYKPKNEDTWTHWTDALKYWASIITKSFKIKGGR